MNLASNVSSCTVTLEFAISIVIICPLTGATSFDSGVVVISITDEVAPLIFSTDAIFNEVIVTAPVV